jgi:hypothetical protein
VRAAIPRRARWRFATIRDRLIKIGARVIEHIAGIRIVARPNRTLNVSRLLVAAETKCWQRLREQMIAGKLPQLPGRAHRG